MAFRTTGIGSAGNRFTVATLPVLAYQHFAVFAIDSQKFFAALRTYFICKIVVAERALPGLDLIYNFTGIVTDLVKKIPLTYPAFCNLGKLHLPVSCEFRLFQVFRHQLQKLFCLGGNMDLIAFFLHHKGMEKFLNNVCSCGNSSKPPSLSQGFRRFFIPCLHKFHRIFHSCKKSCLCKSCWRFCFSCI